MRVELYYFEGCPNWKIADRHLPQALKDTGWEDITVERRQITTLSQAHEVGFIGSPTIRIDDRDPFATGAEQVGMACRVYSTPTGLNGAPSLEQLIEVMS